MIKQGTRIYFRADETIIGYGRIVGYVGTKPLVGGTYIIEPEKSIENVVYPYTHFILDETKFVIQDEKKDENYIKMCRKYNYKP